MPKKKANPGDCPYNSYIECGRHDKCHLCGWNPEVDKRRRKQLNGEETEEQEEADGN